MINVTVTNILTGKDSSMDINITKEQLDRWQSGELIQNVMPEISREIREFLITGITPEDYKKTFGDEAI